MTTPGFFTLTFRSLITPADATLSVRFAPDWADHPCAYQPETRQWQLTAPNPAGNSIQFKFLRNGQWQSGPPTILSAEDLGKPERCIFDDRTVTFSRSETEMIIDSPVPASLYFKLSDDPVDAYDVIVVGSGAGGGTLACQLADLAWPSNPPRKRVLLLEAGSYLFPTHIGNLPRQQPHDAAVEKSMWGLWWKYWVRRWIPADAVSEEAAPGLAQGLNLGGRSIFWGALTPQMRSWEFTDWPTAVANELRETWYERAEELMRIKRLSPSPLQSAVKRALYQAVELSDYSHRDAPMAIEYSGPLTGAIPAGIFSTAELIIDRKMAEATHNDLYVILNNEVVKVVTSAQGGLVTGVVAYDHLSGRERTYNIREGGCVVLSAGSLGTPSIMLQSALSGNQDLIGKGLTDHPIFVVSFKVPRESKWFNEFESSKTLSRHRCEKPGPDGKPAHPYNIVLELGANLNQSRYATASEVDDWVTGDWMPGELVFMLEAQLSDDNVITLPQDWSSGSKPVIKVTPSTIDVDLQAELQAVAAVILAQFGGVESNHLWAPFGGVGHEVGTMRMENDGGRPGVVDADLRVIGYDNLYVCDLSVFPTSPAANPTLTLVSLAMRLAQHIVSK